MLPAYDDLSPVPESNHGGLRPWGVDGSVAHTMVGTIESATARFMNPSSIVSATFGIGLDGRIVLWVDVNEIAYHAGNWPINQRRVGVEHEDDTRYWDAVRTPELYLASGALHAAIARDSGWPPDADHIGPHRNFTATACPDALDVGRIIAIAQGEVMYVDVDTFNARMNDVADSFAAVKDVLAKVAHHTHGEAVLPAALRSGLRRLDVAHVKLSKPTSSRRGARRPRTSPSRAAVLAGHGKGK